MKDKLGESVPGDWQAERLQHESTQEVKKSKCLRLSSGDEQVGGQMFRS